MKWFKGMHYGKAVSVASNSCCAHARTRGFRLNFVLANYIDVSEPYRPVLYTRNSKIKLNVRVIWSPLRELFVIIIIFPSLLGFWLKRFKNIYNLLQFLAITNLSHCAPLYVITRISALSLLLLSPPISHYIKQQAINKPKYSSDRLTVLLKIKSHNWTYGTIITT